MKWLEVIMMEVAGQNREAVQQKISSLISEINHDDGIERTELYCHAMTEHGLSIHIHWESEQVEPWGSPTGLSLCKVLRDFGLISHVVWVEVR